MSILGLQPKVPQVPQGPVGQILTHEGYAKIALVDLGREASDALRASWPAARPFQSAGVDRSSRQDLQPTSGFFVCGPVHRTTDSTKRAWLVSSSVMNPSGLHHQEPNLRFAARRGKCPARGAVDSAPFTQPPTSV